MSNREALITDFLAASGYDDVKRIKIPGDASFRHYERLVRGDKQFILMDAPPEKEDVRPFVTIQKLFCEQGYCVPQLLAQDDEQGLLLLSDVGNASFTRLLAENSADAGEEELYKAAVDVLVQLATDYEAMTAHTHRAPHYDHALLTRELEVCSEWFLPALFSGEKLRVVTDSFHAAWRELLADDQITQPEVLVHRDYHADNLFWVEGQTPVQRVAMLDFQDAVWGRGAYDMVSLLEDARRDVPSALAADCTDYYATQTGCNPERFAHEYALLGAQRNAKILGIFTRLYKRDGKPRYLAMIPRVWAHFVNDCEHPGLAKLKEWKDQHFDDNVLRQIATMSEETLKVAS